MILALGLLACGDEPAPTDTDPVTDADTDADADADTDADTDTDSGIDTAGSTPTGVTGATGATGDTGLACLGTSSDLVAFAEPRDSSGLACTICAAGTIQFFAGLRNPCAVPIDVTVNDGCLIDMFSIAFPSGTGIGSSQSCPSNPVLVTIDAGGTLEEQYDREELSDVGTYQINATITTFPNSQTASATFSVP